MANCNYCTLSTTKCPGLTLCVHEQENRKTIAALKQELKKYRPDHVREYGECIPGCEACRIDDLLINS